MKKYWAELGRRVPFSPREIFMWDTSGGGGHDGRGVLSPTLDKHGGSGAQLKNL